MKKSTQTLRKDLPTYLPPDYPGYVESRRSGEEAAAVRPGLREYAGIFLIAAAVLLFELALTRIFAVILWAHLAFMVVSTALFGFGLSGVYLALRPRWLTPAGRPRLGFLALIVAVAILGSYLTVVNVPFKMWSFHEDWTNFIRLAMWYGALVVPFFFAGLLIAELLSYYPLHAARLYGLDLLGAACGSLLLIPIIPLAGGEGTAMSAALLAAAAGLFLCRPSEKKTLIALVVAAVAFAILVPTVDEIIPLEYHQNKRRYNAAVEQDNILATRWSPLSKVDIATHRPNVLDVWIDGGTNESAVVRWSGDLSRLRPLEWSSIGAIHKLRQNTDANVMIIGPSGGKEVLFALSHGAKHVDAVELDPSIVKLLTSSPFAEFMGNLYQNEKVNLVNDEGRAFLRRQPLETYDIIQFVNNYTPVAIAAGALNLSETFLITKEAFLDYWDHLRPNGVLALHRGATLKVAMTALEALRERGVENPESHIMITAGEVPFFEGFYLKKGPWSKEEELAIHAYMKVRRRVGGKTFLWTPFDPGRKNLYSRVLSSTPEEQRDFYDSLGINLNPATDDKPFIEHFLKFGRHELAPDVPSEFRHRESEKWQGIVPRGDFPYVAILAESALLGLLFVGLPLLMGARGSIRTPGFFRYLLYFSALGFGFITIEICLMKRYVLFLGNPAYSITTILVALLLGAGAGSICSERLAKNGTRRALSIAIPAIALLVIAETVLAPMLFSRLLFLPFAGRVFAAAAMLFPLGFAMGMPFALGLRMISESCPEPEQRRKLVAWAWGMNGYFTVIGSAATVFIALFWGFKAVLLLGLLVYLGGLAAIRGVKTAAA